MKTSPNHPTLKHLSTWDTWEFLDNHMFQGQTDLHELVGFYLRLFMMIYFCAISAPISFSFVFILFILLNLIAEP